MGAAHMVDIGAFHHLHFLLHLFRSHVVPGFRVAFMAVHALHLDRLAVHQEHAVLNHHVAEAHAGGNHLLRLAVTLQRQHQRVQVGVLRGPQFGLGVNAQQGSFEILHAGDAQGLFQHAVIRGVLGLDGLHQLAGSVIQGHGYGTPFQLLGRREQVAHVHLEAPVPVHGAGLGMINVQGPVPLVHRVGLREKVADVDLGHRKNGDVAENAGQAEHVLAFQVRAVGMAVHLRGHHVLPLLEVGADVKAGRIAGILGKAHVLPVDPEVEEGIHAVKLHVHLPAVPVRGHFKRAAVGAYGIPFLVGRVILVGGLLHHIGPGAFKGVRLVGINGGAVALRLPGGGHLDFLPVLHVVIRLVKIGRAALGILGPVELPLAVQGLAPLAVFRQHFQGGLQIAERRKKGRGGLLVQMQVLFLFPFQPCGGGRGGGIARGSQAAHGGAYRQRGTG